MGGKKLAVASVLILSIGLALAAVDATPSTASSDWGSGQVKQLSGNGTGVAIGIKPTAVAAGSNLRYRIENRSDEQVSFGLEFVIQREVSPGTWLRASFSPKGPWPKVSVGLRAGRIGAWQTFEIPLDAEAGSYRIKKEVQLEGRRRFLTAPFEVVVQ